MGWLSNQLSFLGNLGGLHGFRGMEDALGLHGWGGLGGAGLLPKGSSARTAAQIAALGAGAYFAWPYLAGAAGGGASSGMSFMGGGGKGIALSSAVEPGLAGVPLSFSEAGMGTADALGFGSGLMAGSGFGSEAAGLGGIPTQMTGGSGGFWEGAQDWFRKKSGKDLWRMGMGMYGLGNSLAAQRMANAPITDVTSNPMYAAMVESAMRQGRAGGYQGSPVMASIAAGQAGQLYKQLYAEQQQKAANQMGAAYGGLSSLGLLGSGLFGG